MFEDNDNSIDLSNSEPGDLVFSHDRYKVIEEIGRGGMGLVYKCHDLKLDKDVAVKVVAWNFNDEDVARFQMEARLLAQLSHPNILTILDFGYSNDGTLFLVMDLLDGESLSSRIASSGFLEPAIAVPIFIQICDGLAHAHNSGILHRDIKPSNVMLSQTSTDECQVDILDFGLGKLMVDDQKLTRTGAMLGSPPYMSPEQAGGKTVDERSDIYSLGCLMFESLTGAQPFAGNNVHATMYMQISKPAPRLSEIASENASDGSPGKEFDDELESIIGKCLAKDPRERYQNAGDLRKDLALFQEKLQATANESLLSGAFALSGAYKRINISPAQSKLILLFLIVIAGVIAWLVVRSTGSLSSLMPVAAEKPDLSDMSQNSLMSTKEVKSTPGIIEADAPSQEEYEDDTWVCPDKEIDDSRIGEFVDKKKIAYLDLSGTSITGSGIEQIVDKSLKGLRISGLKLDDGALEKISSITTLEELFMSDCKDTTDDGVESLASLSNLVVLDVSGCPLTDRSISALSKLKNLRILSLANCSKLRGQTLGELGRPEFLNNLGLRDSGVLGGNLKRLLKLPNIATLDLAGLGISDADLASISLMRLLVLDISSNPDLTDKGLLGLWPMTSLSTLIVRDCPGITEASIEKFSSQLSRLKIVRGKSKK